MKSLHQPNMKLAIFDFDGTIADTSEGILDAHKYTLKAMGSEIPSDDVLKGLIGGNLLKVYTKKFGFNEEKARKAVAIYRERYADVGIHKAYLYPGVKDLLRSLQKNGIKTGVATLKAESFARIMLNEMRIADYFDVICGMDSNDELDKAGLVLKCMKYCMSKKNETVLVGDSNNDYLGSQEAEVNFIGVTYGFGFCPYTDYTFVVANSLGEVKNYIINMG